MFKYVVSTIDSLIEMGYLRIQYWLRHRWRRDVADDCVDDQWEGIKDGRAASKEQRRRLHQVGHVGGGSRAIALAGDPRGCRSRISHAQHVNDGRGP